MVSKSQSDHYFLVERLLKDSGYPVLPYLVEHELAIAPLQVLVTPRYPMKPASFFLFCLRHAYRETRLFRNIPFVAWRERGGSARLCPFFFHSVEKHFLCACFIFADEINVDHRSKHPVWCTVLTRTGSSFFLYPVGSWTRAAAHSGWV